MSTLPESPPPPPPDNEDPYQVYMLRRPAERSSSVVPQLPKQPEMADTRLRYRRIPPEARSGSLGSLGNHFPPRFEFPHRPSLLESLTSDDETLSFGVTLKKEKKKKKRKRKGKSSTDVSIPSAEETADGDDVSTSLTTQGGSGEFAPDDLPVPRVHGGPMAQSGHVNKVAVRGKGPAGKRQGRRNKAEGRSVTIKDSGITMSADGRPISAPAAMSPAMRAAFVLVAEEPVVYRAGEEKRDRGSKGRKEEDQVFVGERELSVSFAQRRYTAEEAAAVKPLNAIQRLLKAIALAKVTGLRGGRR